MVGIGTQWTVFGWYFFSFWVSGNKLTKTNSKPAWLIDGVSIAVVVIVAVLLAMPNKFDFGTWTKSLPHVIGSVNSLAALALISGYVCIRMKKIEIHRIFMVSAYGLGIVFLVCYVLYHLTNPPSKLGADGVVKLAYLLILASHVLLSIIVLPLVLRAMFFAVTGQISRHRKIARFAFPIWLYVTVSGVTVYLFVHQFFPQT